MRHTHESSISAVSITLVGVIACSILILASTPDLKSLMLAANLTPQPELTQDPPQALPQRIPETAPRTAQSTTRVVDLIPSQEGQATAPSDRRMAEIEQRFQQAVVMLHAQRYDEAVVALHRVLQLSPRLPEAYVNMGYALLGLERYGAAHDFFFTATELEPFQGNAYWGLAVALEKLEDLEGALGAMRTYIHLAAPEDEAYVRKARSALWEWDTRLARGPLPEHEAEWVERMSREWVDRNLPDRDALQDEEIVIPVREIR